MEISEAAAAVSGSGAADKRCKSSCKEIHLQDDLIYI